MTATGTQLRIPFHLATVGEEEACAVADVVRSGWLTMGPRTLEFERQFAAYIGVKHAIAVCSGTAALHLALHAVGIGRDDEVIVPTNTFTATGEVVAYFGARPVLADIDPETLNIDPDDVACRITSRTKAIIPVHIAGRPCDMERIQALAKGHNLHVIEDAAHALPASHRGIPIGALSELTAFSFYATKTLTTGEGGMVTTDDDRLADSIRLMRLHGIGRDAWKRYTAEGSWFYEVLAAGFKYNMTDIQAALGIVQLGKCAAMAAARRAIAQRYTTAFEHVDVLQTPTVPPDFEPSWHLYILRLHPEMMTINRGQFIEALKDRGVGTSVHFIPLHLHPFYQQAYGYRAGDLPKAELEYQRYLSLPIYPGMSDGDIDYVITVVTEVACSARR
jgi:perosamine synthetase